MTIAAGPAPDSAASEGKGEGEKDRLVSKTEAEEEEDDAKAAFYAEVNKEMEKMHVGMGCGKGLVSG